MQGLRPLTAVCFLVVYLLAGAEARWWGSAKNSVHLPEKAVLPQSAHPHMLPEDNKCGILYKEYYPSKLEEEWKAQAELWDQDDTNRDLKNMKPYCEFFTAHSAATAKALACAAEAMAGNSTFAKCENADDVMSHFKVHVKCHNHTMQYIEHIEPIHSALRHPAAISCDKNNKAGWGNGLMNVDQLLLDSWVSGGKYATKGYYFDLGSSGDWTDQSQSWVVETYERRGILFDRIFLYEAIPLKGDDVHRNVPERFYPAFQFLNFPAPKDLQDHRNPLNILTAIAKPEDYVVIKLDIDNFGIEKYWIDAILDNPELSNLIDELMFEHHFQLEPLVSCCWHDTADPDAYLKNSYAVFANLRKKGIRSHYWP